MLVSMGRAPRVIDQAGEESMSPTITEIAESFSRHRFGDTYPSLREDIEWTQIGGKGDVVKACEESARYLANVETTFNTFKVVTGDDCVVIDSRAVYTDSEDGSSTVASCDIYDFVDGDLAAITSYTVELERSPGSG
jgi:hypothetical protein